jgi:hypothetical protein
MPFVKPPYVADTDTVMAYRLNESATAQWTTGASALLDDKGTYHGANAGTTTVAGLRNFNGVVGRYSRYFDGATYFSRANATAMTTMWQGEWTIECWVRLDSLAAAQTIISYGASGESAATNYQVRLQVGTNGLMSMFWEYGGAAATNMVITAVAGTLAINTVYHVACRKKLVGGSYVVSFWVNGIKVDEQTAAANADGGTTCVLEIGRDAGAAASFFAGFMRSLRVSSSALADATILADAGDSTQMHATDAGTFAHWKCTETPDMVDDSNYGVHLRAAQSPAKINAIVNDAGGATGARLFAALQWGTIDLVRTDVAALLLAELTVRFAVYIPSGNAANRGILCWGESGFETDSTRNYLFEVDLSSTRVLKFGWEFAAGSGVSVQCTMPYHGGLYIVHCVRRTDPANAGKYIGEIWVDGERQVSTPNLTPPTGGSNSLPFLGTFSSTTNATTLVLDDVHIQKRALTEYEIKTDAGVLAVANALDTSAPVLAGASPTPAGTTLSVNTAVHLTVTDAALTPISRLVLVVEWGDGSPPEVVRKAAAFQTGYTGSAGATTGGSAYTITRTAGWKKNPVFKAYMRDSLGNDEQFATSVAFVYDPDVAAPTLTANTPAAGSTLTTTQDVSVDVTDASGLARVILMASYGDSAPSEVVFDGSAFATGYTGSTTVVSGTVTRYTFHRSAGWRSTPVIKAYARDTLGNELAFATSLTYAFTPAPPDNPPTIANVSPAPGTALAVSSAITFDLLDDFGFRRIFVYARFASLGRWEVIHDGTSFGPQYDGGSTRTAVGTGYHYSVARDGGWPEAPTLSLLPVDLVGQEPT